MKTFTYFQHSGILLGDNGEQVAIGWAGNHEGKNNPDMQQVRCVGPLPQGTYKVEPWIERHPHLGPFVAPLTQVAGETYGRGDFFIHGPSQNQAKYGQESEGCIVIPRSMRLHVRDLGPDFIEVKA